MKTNMNFILFYICVTVIIKQQEATFFKQVTYNISPLPSDEEPLLENKTIYLGKNNTLYIKFHVDKYINFLWVYHNDIKLRTENGNKIPTSDQSKHIWYFDTSGFDNVEGRWTFTFLYNYETPIIKYYSIQYNNNTYLYQTISVKIKVICPPTITSNGSNVTLNDRSDHMSIFEYTSKETLRLGCRNGQWNCDNASETLKKICPQQTHHHTNTHHAEWEIPITDSDNGSILQCVYKDDPQGPKANLKLVFKSISNDPPTITSNSTNVALNDRSDPHMSMFESHAHTSDETLPLGCSNGNWNCENASETLMNFLTKNKMWLLMAGGVLIFLILLCLIMCYIKHRKRMLKRTNMEYDCLTEDNSRAVQFQGSKLEQIYFPVVDAVKPTNGDDNLYSLPYIERDINKLYSRSIPKNERKIADQNLQYATILHKDNEKHYTNIQNMTKVLQKSNEPEYSSVITDRHQAQCHIEDNYENLFSGKPYHNFKSLKRSEVVIEPSYCEIGRL